MMGLWCYKKGICGGTAGRGIRGTRGGSVAALLEGISAVPEGGGTAGDEVCSATGRGGWQLPVHLKFCTSQY